MGKAALAPPWDAPINPKAAQRFRESGPCATFQKVVVGAYFLWAPICWCQKGDNLMNNPIKTSRRALRRRHFARMKARARRVYRHMDQPERIANHLAFCSCAMCGNPRRMGEVPIAERRLADRLTFALAEVSECRPLRHLRIG